MISRVITLLLDRHRILTPLWLNRLLGPERTRDIDVVRGHISAVLVGIDRVVGGEFDVLHGVVGASFRLPSSDDDIEEEGGDGAQAVGWKGCYQ